jgi:large subunit ribosomal protein L21
MYAIVTIAGQQFKVEKGKKVIVHQLPSEVGEEVTFEKVLLIDNDGKIIVGTPYVKEAAVTAQVVSHLRGDKIKVFKKKRRKGYQILNGHRQYFTELMIEEIIESGFVKKAPKPKKAAEPQKKAEEPQPEQAMVTETKAVSGKKTVKAADKKTTEPKAAAPKAAAEKAKPAAKKTVKKEAAEKAKPAAKKPVAKSKPAAKKEEKTRKK